MRGWIRSLPFVLFLVSWTAWAQDWIPLKLGDPADRGLQVGQDIDGSPTYIIRSPFQGGVTVGKYIPGTRSAYVPWGGKENRVTAIELYVGTGVWQPMNAGDPLPAGAVAGGNEADGSLLYIIRAPHDKAVVPGKYSAGTGKGYIPFGGREIELKSWEILVRPPEPIRDTGALAGLVETVRRHDPGLKVYPLRVDNGAGALYGQLTTQDFQWNGRAVNAFAIALRRDDTAKLTLTGDAPARAQDFEIVVVDPRGRVTEAARTRGPATELELRAVQEGQYTMLVLQRGPGGLARYFVNVETQGANN